MKIFVPASTKQEFKELAAEYNSLFKELELDPYSERRVEIIDRISEISKKFESGLMNVTGFE